VAPIDCSATTTYKSPSPVTLASRITNDHVIDRLATAYGRRMVTMNTTVAGVLSANGSSIFCDNLPREQQQEQLDNFISDYSAKLRDLDRQRAILKARLLHLEILQAPALHSGSGRKQSRC